MIASNKTKTSVPSAPTIRTDELETLARELFNGSLPKLPGDGVKRRLALAREFAAAHLAIPGVSKPDPAKAAALAPAFKAIASSRQARVDAFLAGLAPKPTANSVRQKLVAVLGERALKANVLRAQHQVACALVLLDALEGRDTPMDLHLVDSGQKLVARLDAAFGKAARASLLPRGPGYLTEGLTLLTNLAEALADQQATTTAAATPARTGPAPAAAVPKPPRVTRESLAAAIRSEPDAHIRAALYQHFTSIAEKP